MATKRIKDLTPTAYDGSYKIAVDDETNGTHCMELSNVILHDKFIGSFTITTDNSGRLVDLREYFDMVPNKQYFLRIKFKNFTTTAQKTTIQAYKSDYSVPLRPKEYVTHTCDSKWTGDALTGRGSYQNNYYIQVNSEKCVFAIDNLAASVSMIFSLYHFEDKTITPDMVDNIEQDEIISTIESGINQSKITKTTIPPGILYEISSYTATTSTESGSYKTSNFIYMFKFDDDVKFEGFDDIGTFYIGKETGPGIGFTVGATTADKICDMSFTKNIKKLNKYAINQYNENLDFTNLEYVDDHGCFNSKITIDGTKLRHVGNNGLNASFIRFSESGIGAAVFEALSSVEEGAFNYTGIGCDLSVTFKNLSSVEDYDTNIFKFYQAKNCNISVFNFPQLTSVYNYTFSFDNLFNFRDKYPLYLNLPKCETLPELSSDWKLPSKSKVTYAGGEIIVT